MRKVLGLQFALFVLAVSLMSSCTKSSSVGSELLAGDQVDVEFTDTLTLRMRTSLEDSLIVHDPFRTGSPFSFYSLGDFNDPAFGNVKASIYTQLRASSAILIDAAEFETATLDSIVLSLVYNNDGFYGAADETYTISVHRLTEDMDPFSTYYSNQEFEYDPTPLVTRTFQANPIDSVILGSNTFGSAPQLRIPLSTELGNEFLSQQDTILTDDLNFIDFFKGLYIKADTETDGIMSFDLSSGSSSLSIYFTVQGNDGAEQKRFTYSFNSPLIAKLTNMDHTFTAAIDDAIAGGYAEGAKQIYLQALAGPIAEIAIPYADEISGTIINKAELEFTISVQNTEDFPYPEQIILASRDDDGNLLIIRDVEFALNKGNTSLFGGQVETTTSGTLQQVYKMNIAAAFQDMADGLENKNLFLRILPKQEQASRVILYGPEDPQYPAKLNLTYTRLNQ